MGTMSMLNQAAVEALCSASYMENFLESVENLPDDLQRHVSALRELDCKSREFLQDIANHQDTYLSSSENQQKKKALILIQRALIKCQEIGDEQLQMVGQIVECIEGRARQLEQDLENLDPGSSDKVNKKDDKSKKVSQQTSSSQQTSQVQKTISSVTAASSPSTASTPTKLQNNKIIEDNKLAAKRQRRNRGRIETNMEDEKKVDDKQPKRKKRRKVNKKGNEDNSKNIDLHLDDLDEPTYCLCERISYGEMVGCDNDDCAIEWFHFNCVGLTNKPKGKWYCPNCRGDKANVPKQDKL